MGRLIKRSLFWGTIIGVLSLIITPFGLSFRFIEVLRPVLAPSTYVMRIFLRPEGNVINTGPLLWVSAIGLNILIYSLVIFLLLSIMNKLKNN